MYRHTNPVQPELLSCTISKEIENIIVKIHKINIHKPTFADTYYVLFIQKIENWY